jgi:hypothetical protein
MDARQYGQQFQLFRLRDTQSFPGHQLHQSASTREALQGVRQSVDDGFANKRNRPVTPVGLGERGA